MKLSPHIIFYLARVLRTRTKLPWVSDPLAALLISLLLATPSLAQTFTPHPIADLPQLGNSTTAWADYNNDGYPDCLIAGTLSDGGHTTQLFRNNGDGTFSRYQSFTPVAHASLVWGDVNGDNYLDFHLTGLTTTYQRISELYINQGNETFVQYPTALAGVAYGDATLTDFDQDGDLDLFYTGADARQQPVSYYYENQDSLWAATDVAVPGFTYGSLDVSDYNCDGRPDLLLTGLLANGKRATHVYRNARAARFTFLNTVLPPLSFGQAAWGDYNHDGYPDIALSGTTEDGELISKIYRNNQNEVFTDAVAGLRALGNSSVAWLDYDHDGYSDLFITGLLNTNAKNNLYRNHQDGSFRVVTSDELLAVYDGDVSVIDYDRDGQVDVFVTGYNNRGGESRLFTNNLTNTNAAPRVPDGLLAMPSEDSVQLQWNPASDLETPAASVAYQVYVGTAPDLSDVVPAHALLADGHRTVAAPANAGHNTTFKLNNLPEGRYYWAVQAIDASLRSSAFSAVGSFDICYAIDLGADVAVCAGDSISLQLGQAEDRVDWQSARGITVEDQRTLSLLLFRTDTLYATLTNPLGCVLRDTLVVQVHVLPEVDLGADTSICIYDTLLLTAGQAGDSVNWYSSQRGRLATNTTQLAYEGLTTDTLWAQVTNAHGCVSYDTLVVRVNSLPVAEAGADQLICQGENVVLGALAESGFSYAWHPPPSLSDSTLAQPVATPDTTTTYVLQATSPSGCINYDTVTITVNPPTLLEAGPDRAICWGTSTTLGGAPTAQGAILEYQYTWSPRASLDNAFVPHPVATPDQTTRYTLVAQAGGCPPDTAYVTVEVLDLPTTGISEDVTVGAGEATQLRATGGINYRWFPAEGLSRTDVADPLASPQVTTHYVVTVTNERGCGSLDSVTVFVDNRVFVPNLFSPNGDGQNDAFKVYGAGIETLDLQVYDRRGQRVYHSGSAGEIMETGWDGTWRGAPLPSGNYRWVLRGRFYDGKVVTVGGEHAGKVRLVR